jgi:hypothetical protein
VTMSRPAVQFRGSVCEEGRSASAHGWADTDSPNTPEKVTQQPRLRLGYSLKDRMPNREPRGRNSVATLTCPD